jgi:hypothetical protein
MTQVLVVIVKTDFLVDRIEGDGQRLLWSQVHVELKVSIWTKRMRPQTCAVIICGKHYVCLIYLEGNPPKTTVIVAKYRYPPYIRVDIILGRAYFV